MNSAILLLLPLGFTLAGVATSLYANVPLLYVSVVLFIGVGYSIYDFLARLEGMSL